MRIFINDERRLKAAAKRLAKHLNNSKLSLIQEALSKALGYRDFYDFQTQHKSQAPSLADQELGETAFRQRWVGIVSKSAEFLHEDEGTLQYHLSQTELTGRRGWTLEDHLAIRAESWLAQGIVGPKGRKHGGFGRVQQQDKMLGEAGYIVNFGRPSAILGSSGFWQCADFELQPISGRINPFVPYSHYIPYGYKHDGSLKIYFGREYFPLWIVDGDGRIERPNPWDHLHVGSDGQWFRDITGEHFLSDRTRALALESLARDGISGLPVFANATPTILKCGVTSLSVTVDAQKDHNANRKSWKPTLIGYSKRNQTTHGERGKSMIVENNDWERLLIECGIDVGPSSNPLRYFEFEGNHYFREAEYDWN
jgi:hypothetical protein